MQIKRKRPHSLLLRSDLLPCSYQQVVLLSYGMLLLASLALFRATWRYLNDDHGLTVQETTSLRREPHQRIPPLDPTLTQESMEYVRSIHSLDRSQSLKFLHIPKTAGTAIEYAAGSQQLAWGSCLFNHKPKRDICHYPVNTVEWPQYVGWWHLPRQFFPLAGADPYQNAELFGVVRDTYDRMVSEFYYICTLKVFDWRPDQCNRTRLFEANYMNEWLQHKIGESNERVLLGTSTAATSYLADNGHFTPQYEFIVGPHQVRMVDHVLKLGDELHLQFEALMRAYKLSHIQLKKLNALGAEARDHDKHLGVHHLDRDTLTLLHQRYPHDFDLGGYAKRTIA